jgi:hypothetical protein
MNAFPAILATVLLAAPWSRAQHVVEEPPEDPVQAAIREFNRRDAKKENEVTVVLPPPEADADTEPETEVPPKAAVLVTGTAPEGTELVKEMSAVPEESAGDIEEPEPKPHQGLEVRVEKLQTGTGNIDPSEVKLLAPFPAKPLAAPPAGWLLQASGDAPPLTREVELSSGKKITLTIRPHLLVPETNGADTFAIAEPGFQSSLGYTQDSTVGAILAQSVRQLDDDSKQLGVVIDNLQQLLVSLPKPEPEPDPAPEPTPKKKR